jgi:hypothetical protein
MRGLPATLRERELAFEAKIETRVTERQRERAAERGRLLALGARATPDEWRQVQWALGHRQPIPRARRRPAVTAVLWSTVVNGGGVQDGLEQTARLAYRPQPGDLGMRLRAWAGYGPVSPPESPVFVLLEDGDDESGWRLVHDFGELGGDPVEASAVLRADAGLRVVWGFEPVDTGYWRPTLMVV